MKRPPQPIVMRALALAAQNRSLRHCAETLEAEVLSLQRRLNAVCGERDDTLDLLADAVLQNKELRPDNAALTEINRVLMAHAPSTIEEAET